MITLGVSLYPEKEKIEEIEAYLSFASKCGFTKVFTSLFSVDGTKDEIVAYFKKLTDIAHKYNMKVTGDCNGAFIEKMGASEKDLSIFQQMGIDILRMDFSFNDERDAVLINSMPETEMSTGFVEVIDKAIENGAEPSKISTCHNFYPQRYSAPSLRSLMDINDFWHKRGIKVAFFISSQEKGTHGPWPVSDGLPTCEEHRSISLAAQLKHCIALKNIDEVRIGNAYASESELKECAEVVKRAYIHVPLDERMGFLKEYIPHGDLVRIPFKIHLDENITKLEREILFDYPTHNDMGDCLNYMLRSRFTRMVYMGKSIPARPCHKSKFTRGDVVIVNDQLKHYTGEVQIVLKDMEADGQRNYLGRIEEEEIMILDEMKAKDIFTFIES
ncbi:MAG: DUF871 domain-containing protein [Erysipelotrichaceae bacterium]|nr:DUF871 domain-containing protein [Erysipelotrichaceae bacterium]